MCCISAQRVEMPFFYTRCIVCFDFLRWINFEVFFCTYHAKLFRLDGEHVVFGKVIEGMDAVYAIEGGAGTYSGKPRKKVIIADSGEIPKSDWEDASRSLAGASWQWKQEVFRSYINGSRLQVIYSTLHWFKSMKVDFQYWTACFLGK